MVLRDVHVLVEVATDVIKVAAVHPLHRVAVISCAKFGADEEGDNGGHAQEELVVDDEIEFFSRECADLRKQREKKCAEVRIIDNVHVTFRNNVEHLPRIPFALETQAVYLGVWYLFFDVAERRVRHHGCTHFDKLNDEYFLERLVFRTWTKTMKDSKDKTHEGADVPFDETHPA